MELIAIFIFTFAAVVLAYVLGMLGLLLISSFSLLNILPAWVWTSMLIALTVITFKSPQGQKA